MYWRTHNSTTVQKKTSKMKVYFEKISKYQMFPPKGPTRKQVEPPTLPGCLQRSLGNLPKPRTITVSPLKVSFWTSRQAINESESTKCHQFSYSLLPDYTKVFQITGELFLHVHYKKLRIEIVEKVGSIQTCNACAL